MTRAVQKAWITFSTALGVCGCSWSERGLTSFALPEKSTTSVEKSLRSATGNLKVSATPATALPVWIKSLIKRVQAHLAGKPQDFSAVPVYVETATDFMQSVYSAAQQIPAGTVLTYAELAAHIGKPGAVRAVGTALGKNPIPLIIPCHRIVASSGKLGGFSAPGGVGTKVTLLACEGVSLEKPRLLTTPAQWRKALAHVQQDKAFARWTKAIALPPLKPQQNAEPLAALVAAIVSQQLSTKAAATILQRVQALIVKNGKPDARKILATDDEVLRAAGLSYMKVAYLKDLAQHCVEGKFPTLAQVRQMPDEQIIKQFTQIKGIGRWTVEMYLIFDLGRADVFPADDYGIRKAIAQLHNLAELPPAKQMAQYGEQWKPYRTVASLYLWRMLDKP
jgi:DNA-3-methyladenine glycosylase II